jgi:hypothetical protein
VYFILNFLAKLENQFSKLVPAFRNVTSSVSSRLFIYNAVAAVWGCAHDLDQSGAKLQPINPTPSSLRRVVSFITSQKGVSRRRDGCPFLVLASLNLSSQHAHDDASNLNANRLRQNRGRLLVFLDFPRMSTGHHLPTSRSALSPAVTSPSIQHNVPEDLNIHDTPTKKVPAPHYGHHLTINF